MAEETCRAPEGSVEYEELFDASHDGDLERLEAALLPSMNVNALGADPLQGRAALHVAAQSGNIVAIKFLLAHGAKVDLRNSECETPLHEAAFWARPEAIKVLLDAGADINLPTLDYDYTALHNVLKYKRFVSPEQHETIELLLDQGLDVNDKADHWGSNILDRACLLGSIELVEFLVDRGARLNGALSSAVNDPTITKFLLDRGAKIVSAAGQRSALSSAAGRGNVHVVRLLLNHADDADLANSHEALHWAAAGGREDVVKLLIEHGFDVNRVISNCSMGETPLLATCEVGKLDSERLEVAKLLIKEGADVHARGREGKTAAEKLLHNNEPSGLLCNDVELRQLLAATSPR